MTGEGVDLDGAAHRGRLRFALVGPFAVWRDGTRLEPRELGSRKGRTLLKALLLASTDPVTTDRLADIVWAGSPPERPDRSLATLVSRLRALLGAEVIEGGGGVYRIPSLERIDVDVRLAGQLATEAHDRLAADEPALASAAAQRALELVGDRDLLEDEPDSGWADPSRAALVTLRADLRHAGAEAALALADAAGASRLATAALASDPLDEVACRLLMRASQQRGDVAAGLLAYDRLRSALADELGVDPAARTTELHLAMLRGEPPPTAPATAADRPATAAVRPAAAPPSAGDGFVGRDAEVAQLGRCWSAATAGQPGIVLVVGEAGIGKTRLATQVLEVATATGGLVVRGRCYEAERSMFLGPVVDAISSMVTEVPPERLREAVEPWAGTLAELAPIVGRVLRPLDHVPSSPDIERRRTFEAITSLLRHLAADRPILLFLDDLHNAGSSTLELLHYLARHLGRAKVLILATVRLEEGAEVLRQLEHAAERVDVGPLTASAVGELARTAGANAHADRIVARTRGHTLAVVEMLAALGEVDDDQAEPPVPESLKAAILGRLARAGSGVEELLRGASILGATFELTVVAELLELAVEEAARRTDRAIAAGLLVEDGPLLAFSNDLVREIVYDTTPLPIRIARHRRAVDLFEGTPEALATHARAAGDWRRALDAWLEAAGRAARRYANRDAEELLGYALQAADVGDDPVGATRARLARADVREALADYAGALDDLETAAQLARSVGRPDLEAAALRALGGDVIVGLGRPSIECLPYLEAGLEVAQTAQLGQVEVELLGRLAIVWTNRARFDLATDAAEQALRRARELGEERPTTLALDGLKNVCAYTGDLDRLVEVLQELERLLQSQGDLDLLQWAAFESAIPALARGRWAAAAMAIDRAMALNRRTGHPYASLFVAHRSWIHRVQGEYGQAITQGRKAVELARGSGHPWWQAFAATMLGSILSEIGAHDDAVRHLEGAVAAAEREGMEAYLVRSWCQLALARWRAGDRAHAEDDLARSERLLAAVRAPAGRAFLHGADAYAAVARVHLARGELEDVERLLEVVRAPAEAVGWRDVVATDRLLRGRARLAADDPVEARTLLEDAVALADEVGLEPIAWEAQASLAQVAELAGDAAAAADHQRTADERLAAMAASIDDPVLRDGLLTVGRRSQHGDPDTVA